MRALLLIVTFSLILTSAASAQQPSATPDAQQPAASTQASAPVPVPEPSEKAWSYYRSGIAIWVFNIL
ncbi:MAG: hypothetical protein ACREBD_37550, partial [Blastocatellia bacterium]